jgi:hypothetical protein
MQRILLPVVAALGFAAGCYTQGDVGYSVGYAAPAPAMYYVEPGVSVVAYSDYPVFYSDNYYWRYDGGLWYRSSYYNGGWVVWNDVPYSVRGIDRPYRYARYNPNAPYVRDHRGYQPAYRSTYSAPGPVYRDQRTYSRPVPAQTYAPPVRDHRAPTYSAPAPAPRAAPPVRDHRR